MIYVNLGEIRARSKNSSKNLVVSSKTLIFADKKGDTIMNTIAIDSNIYIKVQKVMLNYIILV